MQAPQLLCFTSVEEVDRAVEEQRQLGIEVSQLLSIRNEFQAACRAPAEILMDIFIQYQADHRRRQQADFWLENPPVHLEWNKLGAVCRRWREVFVSSPLLWTEIFPSSLLWTDLCINRSAQALLQVTNPHWHQARWDTFDRTYRRVMQLASNRIGTLEVIQVIPDGSWPSVRGAGRTTSSDSLVPVPPIENCNLQALQILRICTVQHSDRVRGALRPLDGGSQVYPNLRTLHVEGSDWEFLSDLFRLTLTTLTVSNLIDPPGIEKWFMVLKNMPQLQSLTLHGLFASLGAVETTLATLPNLMSLSMPSMGEPDYWQTYTAFWRGLHLPNVARVSIGLAQSVTLYTDPTLGYPSIARTCLDLHAKNHFTSAHLAWVPVHTSLTTGPEPLQTLYLSSFDISPSQLGAGKGHFDETLPVTFSASFPWTSHGRRFLELLPLSDITTFSIEHEEDDWDPSLEAMLVDLWPTFALRMTNVKALHFSGSMVAKGFLGMLRQSLRLPSNSPDDLPNPTPFFPQLEYLTLTNVCWTDYVFKPEGEEEDVRCSDDEDDVEYFAEFDAFGCCGETHDEDSGCTCSPSWVDTDECGCEDDPNGCDCECRWYCETLNKLVADALRCRQTTGYPRLRRLRVVASETDGRRGLRQHSSDRWGSLVEELEIQFDTPQ